MTIIIRTKRTEVMLVKKKFKRKREKLHDRKQYRYPEDKQY